MSKCNKIISGIVIACFIFNTAISDLAFGQSINFSADKLAAQSKFSNIQSIEDKDIGDIELWFAAALNYVKDYGDITCENLQKYADMPGNLPGKTIYQLPDAQFFINEIPPAKDGILKIKVKRRDLTHGSRTYFIEYSTVNRGIDVYAEGSVGKRKPRTASSLKAAKTYKQHEKVDGILDYAHRTGLTLTAEDARFDYRETVTDIISNLKLDIENPNAMVPLQERSFYIFPLTGEIASMLDESRIEHEAKDGTKQKVILFAHSSNNAVHIFLSKDAIDDLKKSGARAKFIKNRIKEYLVHEVGAMLGLPILRFVDGRPVNEIDERYSEFLLRGRKADLQPKRYSIANLDTNLAARDFAAGEMGRTTRLTWLLKRLNEILIDGNIEMTFVGMDYDRDMNTNKAKFTFAAPPEVAIYREEIYNNQESKRRLDEARAKDNKAGRRLVISRFNGERIIVIRGDAKIAMIEAHFNENAINVRVSIEAPIDISVKPRKPGRPREPGKSPKDALDVKGVSTITAKRQITISAQSSKAQNLEGLLTNLRKLLVSAGDYDSQDPGVIRNVRPQIIIPDRIALTKNRKGKEVLEFKKSTYGPLVQRFVTIDPEEGITAGVITREGFAGTARPPMLFRYKCNPFEVIKGFVVDPDGRINAVVSQDFLSKLAEANSNLDKGEWQEPLEVKDLPIGFISEEDDRRVAKAEQTAGSPAQTQAKPPHPATDMAMSESEKPAKTPAQPIGRIDVEDGYILILPAEGTRLIGANEWIWSEGSEDAATVHFMGNDVDVNVPALSSSFLFWQGHKNGKTRAVIQRHAQTGSSGLEQRPLRGSVLRSIWFDHVKRVLVVVISKEAAADAEGMGDYSEKVTLRNGEELTCRVVPEDSILIGYAAVNLERIAQFEPTREDTKAAPAPAQMPTDTIRFDLPKETRRVFAYGDYLVAIDSNNNPTVFDLRTGKSHSEFSTRTDFYHAEWGGWDGINKLTVSNSNRIILELNDCDRYLISPTHVVVWDKTMQKISAYDLQTQTRLEELFIKYLGNDVEITITVEQKNGKAYIAASPAAQSAQAPIQTQAKPGHPATDMAISDREGAADEQKSGDCFDELDEASQEMIMPYSYEFGGEPGDVRDAIARAALGEIDARELERRAPGIIGSTSIVLGFLKGRVKRKLPGETPVRSVTKPVGIGEFSLEDRVASAVEPAKGRKPQADRFEQRPAMAVDVPGPSAQSLRFKLGQKLSLFEDAGKQIPTAPETRYTLLVDNNVYKDSECAEDIEGYLLADGRHIGAGDRFNLEKVDTANVDNILDHVKDPSRTIVQVSRELTAAELNKLNGKAPGLRIVRIDTTYFKNGDLDKDKRRDCRFDLYGMMLLARRVTEKDREENNSIYQSLAFLLDTHCEEVVSDRYIEAILKGNLEGMLFIIKHNLSYRPAGRWAVPEYHTVTAALISA